MIEGRTLFVSGEWRASKSDYAKLILEWPVTDLGLRRWRLSGFFSKILWLFKHDFVLKLEDPTFLLNIIRIFSSGRSVAIWGIDSAEESDFKTALVARSFALDSWCTHFGKDLELFAPNLFWFSFLEDMSYEETFLSLHCGEKVPSALKQIISDNNLEPYVEYAANR